MPEFRAVVILTWESTTLSDASQEIEGAIDDLKQANTAQVGHISVSRIEDITDSKLAPIARARYIDAGTST